MIGNSLIEWVLNWVDIKKKKKLIVWSWVDDWNRNGTAMQGASGVIATKKSTWLIYLISSEFSKSNTCYSFVNLHNNQYILFEEELNVFYVILPSNDVMYIQEIDSVFLTLTTNIHHHQLTNQPTNQQTNSPTTSTNSNTQS